MINRFGNSSTLLTASSSDFSYLLKGGTGFVRVLASINRKRRDKEYKNISVYEKYKAITFVCPVPCTLLNASGNVTFSGCMLFASGGRICLA